jgi:hypothetical protein
MADIDVIFISVALLYAVLGVGLGIGMGIAESFAYAHVHAHINLLGFANMVVYGLIHRAWPVLRQSKLAVVHFWLAMIGTPIFLIGLPFAMFKGQPIGAILGSMIVLAGMIVFAILFIRNASKASVPGAAAAARA